MATIPLPRLTFGKTKDNSVMCQIRAMAGNMETREFTLHRGLAWDEEGRRAYYIDTDNQYQDDSGTWVQILDERSCVPYHFHQKATFTPEELQTLKETSFKLGFKASFHESIEKIKQDEVWDKVFKIVIVISATILIIAGFRIFGG